jgi:exoribonuclease II
MDGPIGPATPATVKDVMTALRQANEILKEKQARIAEPEAVIAPLLDHYIAAYDGGMDALAINAAALVPDWKQRSEK